MTKIEVFSTLLEAIQMQVNQVQVPAKKARRLKPHRKASKMLPMRRQCRRINLPQLNFKQKQWFILPEHAARIPVVYRHFFFKSIQTIVAAQEYLFQTKLEVNPFYLYNNTFQFRCVRSYILEGSRFYSSQFVKEMQRLIRLNKRVRMGFHRLLQIWRFKRLRQANKDDLLTTEPPKDPIWICDWKANCKYVFEARTLYKDIMERISFSDELIVSVKPPRNPFTNEPLDTLQLALIVAALRQRGITSWQLEGLRSNQYSLADYRAEFDLPLHLLALEKLFKNPVSAECIDLVHDFIEYHHELHGLNFDRSIAWVWYLERHHRHPIIRKWREICHEYYRLRIMKAASLQNSYLPIITTATLRLLMESTDNLYLQYLNREI